jgi:hypothetical protein
MQHNLKTDTLPNSYPGVLSSVSMHGTKCSKSYLSSPRLKSNTNIPILISV